jgi:hypothetical protein
VALLQLELLRDVLHVVLDRLVADEQLLGDLAVRVALRDQAQDLVLARVRPGSPAVG